MPQLISTTIMKGGLNLITPAIQTPPGMCIAAQNYEPEVRGYRRMAGYERYDGRPKPSEASYWMLNFTGGSSAIAAGAIVVGGTSGATAIALINGVLQSGVYGSSTAAGYLVLYQVSGTFQAGEDLKVATVKVAVAADTAVERGAVSAEDDQTWLRSAIELSRSAIQKVPGSGPVRGVWDYAGSRYAFRDNVGGTACVMYKSTAAGWVAQTLGHVVAFTAGTTEFLQGEVLTQGGVTSIIRYVVVTSGTWGTNDAAGYIVVSNIAGGNYTAGAATSASGAATLSGAQTASALPPGGRYAFVNHNFYGAAKSAVMYGCNGVGPAFMWDGTYFAPIRTGLGDALDKPTRISEFSNHLFLGYSTGEIQFSAIGNPLSFLPLDGAGSFTFGEAVTDMTETAATALVIFGRRRISYVAGSSSDDFILTPLSGEAGATAWTTQVMDMPIYLDDIGVRRMSSSQAYGNWRMGTLTEQVTPWFSRKRAKGVTAVASIRNKAKDQYWLFMSDGSGLIIYLGRNAPEVMPFQLPVVITCTCTGISAADDREFLYVGDDQGFVYQLDVGTSFDGQQVSAYVLLPFNAVGSPMQRKRFHMAMLEVDAGPQTLIAMTAEYSYGDPDQPAGLEQMFNVSGGGGFWNDADWNQFYWATTTQGIAQSELEGVGRNVAIGVLSDAIYEDPHTLSSISIYFTYRGMAK